jgi:serine protease Do
MGMMTPHADQFVHSLLRQRQAVALVVAAGLLWFAPATASAAKLSDVIRNVQQRSVKIYGAGGVKRLEAYQSGFLVSADGHIVTVFSHVLDSEVVTVILDDGRKFEAKLLGADPRLEVAVLKIEAADLPFFDLHQAATGAEGNGVLAFSNLFGIANGDEPVSVQHGTISAVAPLAARRGAYETPYQGPVYVLDAMTNNPGAAGGALTNMRGELLGMLGEQLRNAHNNTWLNYAVPAHELVEAVEAIKAGQSRSDDNHLAHQRPPEKPLTVADLGLVLVPNVLERTPPFIDEVRPDSPAAKADIHPDDLILFVNDQLVQSCRALQAELEKLNNDAEVRLVILRNSEMKEVTLRGSESGNGNAASK